LEAERCSNMASIEKRTRNGQVRWYMRYRDPAGAQRTKTFDPGLPAGRRGPGRGRRGLGRRPRSTGRGPPAVCRRRGGRCCGPGPGSSRHRPRLRRCVPQRPGVRRRWWLPGRHRRCWRRRARRGGARTRRAGPVRRGFRQQPPRRRCGARSRSRCRGWRHRRRGRCAASRSGPRPRSVPPPRS